MPPEPSELPPFPSGSPDEPPTGALAGQTLDKAGSGALLGEGAVLGRSEQPSSPGAAARPILPGASPAATGAEPAAIAPVDTEPDCIQTLDLEGKILSVNAGGRQVLGIAAPDDPRLLAPWADLWRGPGVNEALRAVVQARGGRTMRFEGSLATVIGVSKFWEATVSPVPGADGEPERLLAVMRPIIYRSPDVSARRETEKELEDVQMRLDAALTAGEIGTWVWDIPAERIFADKNLARLFFIRPEEAASGMPLARFVDVIHPADVERASAWIGQAIARGGACETEYRVVSPAGEVRWLNPRGTVEMDAQGRAFRFVGVVLDITARKEAEEALAATARELAQQTRVFNTALSATDDFAYLFDLEGRFLYANRRLLEVWGRTLAEIVGRNCYDLGYLEWHADMHMREIRQVIETRRPITGEVPYSSPTGHFGVYEYIFTPVFGADGGVEMISGTTHDVTLQRQSLQALRESEERFRQLADAMPQIVWAARPDGVLDYTNRRWLEYIDRREGGVSPNDWGNYVHPEDVAGAGGTWAAALRAGTPYATEFRVRRADGEFRWFLVRALPIKDADGTIQRWYGTCTDIHDQKELQREREEWLAGERAARAEAERTSRMKDEFLTTLSHELRTPLNAILGWAQVLRSAPAASAAYDPAAAADDLELGLATIERNARAQAQIIDDLLDMSRIISGKVRLDVQRVDLAPVVQAAIDTMMPAAEAKGIRLQTILDPQARPVSGDPNRLQQVFWNILSNAIKFTPRGGRVQVTLARVNSHLEVGFGDSGEGISPEFLPFVFERFRQADASSTRRHGGLGLGLAIVKQLVELHGGTVQAASAGLGLGTSFVVSLPLMAAVQQPAARVEEAGGRETAEPRDNGAPEAEAGRRGQAGAFASEDRRHPQTSFVSPGGVTLEMDLRGLSVLVVDDEADARALLQRLLEEREVKVLAASSAQEAFELALAQRPDVLVSDIGMPGQDGYWLIRRIRAHEAQDGGSRKLPAVALTAYARAEDRMKAVLAGFQMHISKPVEAAELLAMVASLGGRA